MDVLLSRFGVSERRACRTVGQHRSTQRLIPPEMPSEDEALTNWLKEFSIAHPRWGYKRAYALAVDEGWIVNKKRVQRLWRATGLKVPYRKRKKPYRGAASGMGVHQPTRENVIWALDFQFDQTRDTRVVKILNIIDEYSREALASMARRSINAAEVVAVLDDLLAERGKPHFIRCGLKSEICFECIHNTWKRACSAHRNNFGGYDATVESKDQRSQLAIGAANKHSS